MSEKELICVNCPKGCRITAVLENDILKEITGYSCIRGKNYAEKEFTRPERILTTTVRIEHALHRVLPVISTSEIPLDLIMDAMREIRTVSIEAPVSAGDIIIRNILNTGADIIASRSFERI